MAACPNSRATVWLGCAPTDSQYCTRSMSRPKCLLPSLPAHQYHQSVDMAVQNKLAETPLLHQAKCRRQPQAHMVWGHNAPGSLYAFRL